MTEPRDKENTLSIEPSNIRNIDKAMLDYINNFDLFVKTNKGSKETPVIWTGAERVYQIKNNKKLRDESGVLILPQITVLRDQTTKDMSDRGSYWSDIPDNKDYKGGAITFAKKINHKKTSNFANADALRKGGKLNFQTRKKNNKVVYSILTIPNPTYITMNYKVMIRTEYQQHMNELLQPFLTDSRSSNYFLITSNGHRYEAFYEDQVGIDNNIMNFDEQERIFKSEINIRVLGHLFGEGPNDPQPTKTVRENAVQLSLGEEVITGSVEDYMNSLNN